jgi:NosR/NirI family nitrous oxide reductase transcriptional regulator
MLENIPAVPVLNGDETLGYAYITSDFVSTTGYSGKPIHVMVAIGLDGKLIRAELVEHHEPIVLIGIPESEIKTMITSFDGLDIVAEAAASGTGHDLDIISGATVTIMIIDDSIVRSSIKVARALGLGGLEASGVNAGPSYILNMDKKDIYDWQTLSGNGSIRRLTLDIGQINSAFEETGDIRVNKYPEKGADEDIFIDMHGALVSAPSIGLSLLGEAEYSNLLDWLEEGEHAIMLGGRGVFSFKGTGYVRGGAFDRIQLIQGDISARFRDSQQKRIGEVAAEGAPTFTELDIFKIPADIGFDATRPWHIQLLVNRPVGAIEKLFLTYDLGYNIPEQYLTLVAGETLTTSLTDEDAAARSALWKKIWKDKQFEIAILLLMITIVTVVFFFQVQATRNKRAFYWFRMSFLAMTLIFIGWMTNAQLSIVNLMALGASFQNGFSWDAFLLDPLIFILWVSVAASLLFWGRGAYCGWLCPFGALQEITNQIARFFKVPQWTLPWGLHERLWPLKYMIFLALFGLSLASLGLAEQYAEVEPFKTAIILKFARAWPYILFVTVILGAGLFIERFYCRYLCPLGAALAIPGRIRMFDWLKRYKECGSPCQTCANECFVQAIHPTGEINPNECLSCLHCQVLYQDDTKCPVVIKKLKGREKLAKSTAQSAAALAKHK